MAVAGLNAALLSFIGGVLFGTWASISYSMIAFVALLSMLCALLWRYTRQDVYAGVWYIGAVVLFCIALGLTRASWQHEQFGHSVLQSLVGAEVSLTGTVVLEPSLREASLLLVVKVADDHLLVTTDRYTTVAYGDVVTVTGILREPEAFMTELGRMFDYEGYLRAQGIEYQVSFATLLVVKSGSGNALLASLLAGKAALMRGIESALPEPAAGLGEGLLLGVKQALGEDLERSFRETGIIHIVVLSGYNVMIVVAFLLYFLRSFVSARARVILGLIGITAFAFMVGLSATVVRACLMASVLLIAEATGRQYLALRALLFAAALMLVWNPYLLLFDIGFQLSFMATLGLILISPRLDPYLAFMPTIAGLRSFLGATVATQIAVLPLLLFHIGEVSVIAIVVNLLVLPLVPLAMLLTFLTGLLGLLALPGAPVIGAFAYAALSYIIAIAEWFATFPYATIVLPEFSSGAVVGAYLVLASVLWYSIARERVLSRGDVYDLADWIIEEERETTKTQRAAP